MQAMASCPFPFLDKWKEIAWKNPVLGFIDAMLCGFSQIIFSDNSFSGLLFVIACFVVSPKVGIAGLWSALISVGFQKLVGVGDIAFKLGVNTFCPVLTGIIMSGLLFVDGLNVRFFLFFGLAALFATILSLAMSAIFSRWNASALGMPFAITVLIFMAAAQNMGFVSQAETVIAHLPQVVGPEVTDGWTIAELLRSTYTGMSELIGGFGIPETILIAAALLISSRIDFISAILGALLAAASAAFFGIGEMVVLIGLYSYNGVLLLLVLNGRSFKITPKSFILNLILAGMTSFLSAWLSVTFGLVGAVYTAFPFSIIACMMMFAAPNMPALTYYEPIYWGVPETVPKNKAAAEEKTM